MQPAAIIGPFLAMAVLTLAVWILLYVRRVRYLLAERIDPQRIATPEQKHALIPAEVNLPANNLANLFELPVLFYALCLYLYVSGTADLAFVGAAWVFVAARALHSFVHCTSNHVMTRFRIYMAASLALWFMLLRAVIQYVR